MELRDFKTVGLRDCGTAGLQEGDTAGLQEGETAGLLDCRTAGLRVGVGEKGVDCRRPGSVRLSSCPRCPGWLGSNDIKCRF